MHKSHTVRSLAGPTYQFADIIGQDIAEISVSAYMFSDIKTGQKNAWISVSLGKLNRRQLDLYLSRKTFRLLSKGFHQFVRIGLTSPH